ncbi:hypothetical protein M5K25_010519 [Dendrobium thyrsiflorum]|uniref:Isopenicillin N synthase-like Fe(2+) 2OG dioxygenase domain-containing protein n=1 Tax=Dendrobium thyrsiflorum TaxID=117978 RepID=A0ABD0V0P7_DENTH
MGSLGPELPKVDLSGLDATRFDEEIWAKARSTIAQALETHDGFEVIYSELPYHGFLLKKTGFPFSALELTNPTSLITIQEYANDFWPQGNDFFCNTILNFATHMQVLILIIHRMTLECLGLEDYYDSQIKSLSYSIRFAKYHKDVLDRGNTYALPSHKDPNYISIICQHNVEGLEVQNICDEWIATKPLTNSFTVLVGEAFEAWTNGRLHAPNHRVKLKNEIEKRYAVIFSTIPILTDDIISAPKELIDEQYPLLYKSFKYYDYIKFRFTDEGDFENPLKVYCGV